LKKRTNLEKKNEDFLHFSLNNLVFLPFA